MLNQWKIGRKPDNNYVINNPEVSKRHATLTQVSDNAFLLEDHNSTAGTRVNGVKIDRIVLGLNDEFQVASVTIKVKAIVNPPPKPAPLPSLPSVQAIFIQTEFLKLESIWNAHKKVQTISAVTSLAITAAGTLIGGTLVPGMGALLGGTFAKLGTMIIDKPEAIKVIEYEFKEKYICPKCQSHFGNTPFSDLKKQNKCPNHRCKVVFIT